jgi:hypothetical protein
MFLELNYGVFFFHLKDLIEPCLQTRAFVVYKSTSLVFGPSTRLLLSAWIVLKSLVDVYVRYRRVRHSNPNLERGFLCSVLCALCFVRSIVSHVLTIMPGGRDVSELSSYLVYAASAATSAAAQAIQAAAQASAQVAAG